MSFKTFLSDDIATTRTLLHEAVPISGSIVQTSGNVKKFGHQMFQSVYDYTYTNSSANHIFDVTHGHHPSLAGVVTTDNYYNKRKNIYNQMAQVLVGHDTTGAIRKFDKDGDFAGTQGVHESMVFINFARLLGKDEIKKGSFSLTLDTSVAFPAGNAQNTNSITITDTGAESNYRANSPAGEYGILTISGTSGTGLDTHWDGNSEATTPRCGLIYYQAGVVAISTEVFNEYNAMSNPSGFLTDGGGDRQMNGDTDTFADLLTGNSDMDAINDGIRQRVYSISFNNTTELNSTIYFCRVGHNDFNYSANPTYLENSRIRVKNRTTDAPVSYITTVGLYSSRNELLAVAKLSEPLRKDPTNDITLRVRLDY